MPSMTIMNKESGKSQGVKYAALAVVAGGLFVTHELGGELFENAGYNSQVDAVEKLIKKGDLKGAKLLLEKYQENKVLNLGDILALHSQVRTKKKQQQLATLDFFIQNGNYDISKDLLSEIRASGNFQPLTIKKYEGKVEGVSLEGLVRGAGRTTGRDQFVFIDKIENYYPEYEGLPELKKQKLRTYLHFLKGGFLGSPDKVLPKLKEFHSWLKRQKPAVVIEGDYTILFKQGRSYLSTQKPEVSSIYKPGDEVIIAQNLGDGKKYKYKTGWSSRNTDDIPIGSKGIILRYQITQERYVVKIKGGDQVWFSPFEISSAKKSTLAEIAYHLNALQQYVQQVKGGK